LGGSVLTAQPRISDGVTRALREEGFSPEMRKVPDGVVGAAVLALRLAGTDVDAEVFERITTTLAHLR
jgi:hypothetical protein